MKAPFLLLVLFQYITAHMVNTTKIGTATAINKQASFVLDKAKIVEYAKKYALIPNHKCTGSHLANTPYPFFGNEICGYKNHGGDSANFVAQCLCAGSHPPLPHNVGPNRLKQILINSFGWVHTVHPRVGSVVHFGDTNAFVGVVVGMADGVPLIATHSPNYFGIKYFFFLEEFPKYEFLVHD